MSRHRQYPRRLPHLPPATGRPRNHVTNHSCACTHDCGGGEGHHKRADGTVVTVAWDHDAEGWGWSDASGPTTAPFLSAEAALADACDPGNDPGGSDDHDFPLNW